MRPGREIGAQVAREVFGYEVYAKNKVLHEKAEKGDRPLRPYSQDIEWAWKVVEKMRVALFPLEGGDWFAFVGPTEGWVSPKTMLEFLEKGDQSECGAAVGENPATVICQAALEALEKRRDLDAPSNVVVTEGLSPANEHH
jgi:hypothetical protein